MAFWMAAQLAVRMNENSFRDKYERYMKQGSGQRRCLPQGGDGRRGEDREGGLCVSQGLEHYRGYHEYALPSGSIPLNRTVGAPDSRVRGIPPVGGRRIYMQT